MFSFFERYHLYFYDTLCTFSLDDMLPVSRPTDDISLSYADVNFRELAVVRDGVLAFTNSHFFTADACSFIFCVLFDIYLLFSMYDSQLYRTLFANLIGSTKTIIKHAWQDVASLQKLRVYHFIRSIHRKSPSAAIAGKINTPTKVHSAGLICSNPSSIHKTSVRFHRDRSVIGQ